MGVGVSVDRLERALWRLRKLKRETVTNHELRRAIMLECGTDPKTHRNNRKALLDLGWVTPKGKSKVCLTGNDLTGDE